MVLSAATAALSAPALSAAVTLGVQVAAVAACVAVVYIGVALVAAFVSRSKGGLWEVYASPEYKNVSHQHFTPSAPPPDYSTATEPSALFWRNEVHDVLPPAYDDPRDRRDSFRW